MRFLRLLKDLAGHWGAGYTGGVKLMSVSKSRNGAGSRSSVRSAKAPGRRMRMGLLGSTALVAATLAASGVMAQDIDTFTGWGGGFFHQHGGYAEGFLLTPSASQTYLQTVSFLTYNTPTSFSVSLLSGVNDTTYGSLLGSYTPTFSSSYMGYSVYTANFNISLTAGQVYRILSGGPGVESDLVIDGYGNGGGRNYSITYASGSPSFYTAGESIAYRATFGAPAVTPDIGGGQSYTTSQLASSLVNPVFSGGTLNVSANGTVTNDFTVDSSGGIIGGGGFNSTFSGVFSDGATPGGSLTINGGGTVAFSGTNTFTGGVIVDGATLVLNNTAGAGTGTIHMVDPQINFGATGTYNNDISLEVADGQQAADPTVLNNTSGGGITLAGRIYETPGVGGANQYVTFSGFGTTTLTNASNSWGGVTTINSGTSLSGTASTISGGSIVINNTIGFGLTYTDTVAGTVTQNISGSGTVNVTGTGPITFTGALTNLGGTFGALLLNNVNSNVTVAGSISGANASAVNGAGRLTVAEGGSIAGGQFLGVRANNAITINNQGSITNTGTGGDGAIGAAIGVFNTASVTNGAVDNTDALIQGRNAGVRHDTGGTLTLNNYGLIIGDIYNGVENTAGGLNLTNYAGGYIWTQLGNGVLSASGSAVTVTNAGVIGRNVAGTQTVGGYGVSASGALTLNNQSGGLIVGQTGGVNAGSTISGANTGTIQGLSGNGLTLANGGTYTNGSGGQILGSVNGVQSNAGTLTLTNGGAITGDTGTGVISSGVLTLTNNAGGVISGSLNSGSGVGVNALAAGSTITNAGRIESGSSAGVQLAGGTVNNQTGGVIIAAGNGVVATGSVGVTNAGTIQGSSQTGIDLQAGGTVQNLAGGVISGSTYGVLSQGALTLTNAGSISGGAGVQVNGSGNLTLTNQANGQISAGGSGIVFASTGAADITNSGQTGSIVSFGNGVMTINNQASGTVSAAFSAIDSQNGGRLTVTNAGAVTGGQWGIVGRNANDSITNSGTIQGVNQQGVILAAGGALTNQATGVIRGANDAVQLLNSGTVTNAGQIHGGTGSFQRGVFATGASSTVANQTGGAIDGWRGVELSGGVTTGIVNNAGTINGIGSVGVLFFGANGTVSNNAGGLISGTTEGVYGAGALTVNNLSGASITSAARGVSTAGTLSLTNAGQIHGGLDGFEYGVIFNGANSTVNNQAGGVIDGWRGIQVSGGASNATINNVGTIQSFGNYGVITFNTATINNLAGGLITSDIGGVYANGFALTLTNAGTITGGQYNGVTATAGGTITNLAGGVINAMPVGGWGVLTYANTTVGNDGVINADSGLATAGGVLTLTNTGTINGTVDGLLGVGGVFDVTNSGTISASNTTTGRGLNLGGGANTITNQATGVISGWRGIELAANAGGSTITNGGSIMGAQQGILSLAGGVSVANTGAISASAGHGVYLDLGGTLTNSGTITGSNHAFIGRDGVSNVTNQLGGVMTGTTYNAVYTGGAGSVISNVGLMNGGNAGVYTDGANTSLTNTGTIRVTGTTAPTVVSGVYMAGAGSSVTNAGTIESTLTDGRGVYLSGGAGSITNQSGGVISGNGAGAAIILTGTDYTLELQSGSTVNGVIDASLSDGHNVLTVAGAANGGYVGGTGADDVTLMGGMTLTGVLNGMDGVDSLILAGAADGALNAGVLDGFESRTMNGTGSWTLSGADGDTSTWTLNSGVLRVTGNQSINNAADVVINAGGTLAVVDSEAVGALSGTGSVVVSDLQALLVGADDSSSTFDGVISGLGGLQHVGTGVLTLTGANTYTGATVVSSGTLQLGASGVIADGSDLSVASGATLDLQGFNETVDLAIISGTLNGTGALTGSEYQLNSATVNANLGAGNLFNVSGNSTLNGTAASANVSVLAGTLTLGAADRLNDAAILTIASGATFDLDGHNETVGSAFINGTLEGFGTIAPPPMPALFEKGAYDGRQVLPGVGTGILTAGQYVLNGATINGNLGAGNLFNIGGVSTLTGTSGSLNVAVQAGTLRLEADNRLADGATLTVSAGATFDLYGHNETVNLAVINGTLDGFGTTLAPIGWGYDKTVSDLVERLPGVGIGTLTASQYQLNGATINGNLGAGTLFNVSGLSILNGTAGANAVSVLAGTLRLGAGNRLSDSATVSVSSGATLDLQSFSDTVNMALLNGVLAGTGTLTAGEYQLNGATVNSNLGVGNLFNTGGVSLLSGTSNAANVVVQSGTLRLGASDRISNTADLSVSTGATFDLNGNMETVRGLFGSGNVAVGAGRLTFGGVDSGFNGVLSGAGSVVHTANLFTLMGNGHTLNTFSNTGGELRFLASTTGNVNVSGGSMTGAGTIGGALTVSGGATLSPGLTGTNNGIGGFNVGSLVMNGGRLSLDVLGVSGGNLTDVIQVTGNANLTGGTLAPNFHGPVTDFDFSTRYLFLTAGSRTGTFANGNAFTADPGGLAGLYWRLRYDLVTNGVVMELRQLTNFTGSDGTANENQVAGALSEGQLEASDDWANVLSAFAGLDRDEQLAAFDSAGGEAIADISTSLFGANDSFMSAVRGASSSQANAGAPMNFASTLGFVGGHEGESAMVANVLGAFDPGAEVAAANGGWISAYAGDANLEGKPGQADVQTQMNGFAGGWATTQGDITVGVAGGVTRVEGDVDQRASTYESDLTHGAAFMRFDNGSWAVGVTGSLYGGQIDSRRTITVGALTGVATGSTDGEGQSISASVSRRFQLDGDTMLALGAETTASRINLDGFTEAGAGGLSLEVAAQSREWLTTVLSGRINRTYRLNGRDFGFYGGLGVMLTSGDRQALADMRFSGAAIGFGDFTVEGAETAPVAGVADIGFEADMSDNTTVSLGYRGVFNERLDDHQVGARIQIRW